MNNKDLLKKYSARLSFEGVLKSALIGIICGFGVIFVGTFVSWMTEYFAGLWISLAVGVIIALAVGVICYFKKFRPTPKSIAARVDSLGLEERFITMLDYEDDNSYIAVRQREDAQAKISTTDHKQIKFNLSKKAMIIASSCAAVGITMSVLTCLSAAGIIKSGLEIVDPDHNASITFTITYETEKGGIIEGEVFQVIEVGVNKPEEVVAVADDGWVFVEWDDGKGNPFRVDDDLTEDRVFVAVFEQIDDSDGEPGDGDGMPSDDGGEGPKDFKLGEDGSGNGRPDPDSPPGGGEGNNRDNSINQVIDGDTFYEDVLDDYRQDSENKNAEDDDMPQELKDFINSYYGGL